jgi:hypothetical protein
MERQSGRRTVLGAVAAGAGVLLLGGRAGGAFAAGARRQQGGGAGTPGSGANQEDARVTAPANDQRDELWGRWLALWNGDLAVADEIVAPGFVAHFAPAGNSPAEVRGPEGLKGWIGGALAAFEAYGFTTAVGPLAEGDLIAGRWVFRGTYRGGIPGSAPDAVGRPVAYAGMDLLRVEDGKIVEYWLSADILQMLQQIGVIPS